MEAMGVRFVGINGETGWKLLLTLGVVATVVVVAFVLRRIIVATMHGERRRRARFWGDQGISLFAALAIVVGLLSIWFDDPRRLTTAVGLVSAGLAFALQKVVTSIAGYFVILRGKNFTIGDRITMGGVRGDVIALGFIQTTIMEMGQPPSVQNADPAMWVKSRQFTGRIVTVANSRIFDEPIYNYTRDFPYIWDEMTLPIAYRDDRARVEEILLDVARRHAVDPQTLTPQASAHLARRFGLQVGEFAPRVYWRLTDNWLALTVRFVVPDHGTRDVKDQMSRDLLRQLDAAGIGIASATFEIVGVPPLRMVDGAVRA